MSTSACGQHQHFISTSAWASSRRWQSEEEVQRPGGQQITRGRSCLPLPFIFLKENSTTANPTWQTYLCRKPQTMLQTQLCRQTHGTSKALGKNNMACPAPQLLKDSMSWGGAIGKGECLTSGRAQFLLH